MAVAIVEKELVINHKENNNEHKIWLSLVNEKVVRTKNRERLRCHQYKRENHQQERVNGDRKMTKG